MAGLSQKDQKRLLKHLEAQGVTVMNTKSGYLLKLPDGKTAMLHKTASDRMAPMALRAKIKRSGLTWPFDGAKAEMPKYITEGGMRQSTVDRYKSVLVDENGNLPDEVFPPDLLRADWEARHPDQPLPRNPQFVQTYKALYALGYIPGTEYKHGRGRAWIQPPVIEEDEPVKPAKPFAPEKFWTSEQRAEQEAAEREQRARAEQAAAGDGQTISVGPVSVGEPEPIKEKPVHHNVTHLSAAHHGREFIDSVESWTMHTDALSSTMTLDDLTSTLGALGLEFEIRVWRSE